MHTPTKPAARAYFPATLCAEHDSPIDALLALSVPRDEAMDLVAASWLAGEATCLVAILDGGRPVVVLRTQEGRWAACNAFFSDLSSTPEAAGRRLSKLLKRRRRGYVAWMPVADTRPEEVPGFAMACGRGWDAEASDAGSHSEVSPALHPWACAGCKKKPA